MLVYKNHHVYIFSCKVLSVVFKVSSTILLMSKGALVIRIVHGRTSYDVLFLPLPPLLFQERHKNFLSLGMQIDSFAFFSLTSIIVQLESVLNSLYSHTRKSIHYIFWVSQFNFLCLLHFKPSLNKHTLFSLICCFLLLKLLNYNAVVSRGSHRNNRFC